MNVIDITITEAEGGVTHDDYNNVLILRLGNGTSVRIEGSALRRVTDALPSGDGDISALSDRVSHLRSALENAQSNIQSALEDADSSIAEVQTAIERAQQTVGCHGDVGSALDDVETAVSDLESA